MYPKNYHTRYTLRHILLYSLSAVVVVCFVLYVLFQARFVLEGPLITFSELPEQVQDERVIQLSGHTENIVSLTLNGREIYTDTSGYFNEAIVLENGYTVVTFTARDRYGRERSYEQSFVYTATQPNLTNSYGTKENKQENS